MSEQEKLNLYARLSETMKRTTQALLERKAKLGETVVIADSDGMPLEVTANEALSIFNNRNDDK